MPQHKLYYHDDGNLQHEIARAREVVAKCKELLQQSCPDTFLGRQRQKPIPPSYDQGEATVSGVDGSQPADLPINDHSSVGASDLSSDDTD